MEREVDSELAFHLEMRVRELLEQGMTPDDARAAALERFGDVDRITEACRDLGWRRNEDMRRADWLKVVKVWFQVADFVNDPKNVDEAAKIMGARVKLSGDEYKPLMKGTFYLGLTGNQKAYAKAESLESVYGSSKMVDAFFTKYKMYKAAVKYEDYFDGSLVDTSQVASLSAPVTSARLGSFDGLNEMFEGRLDDVRIYAQAISPTAVRALASGAADF